MNKNLLTHILTRLSITVEKKFNKDEVHYILNYLDQNQRLPNEMQEEKNKWYIKFFRNMILHFMPDSEKRQNALENLPYFEDL